MSTPPIRVALVMGKCATGGIKSYILGLLKGIPRKRFELVVFAYSGFSDEDTVAFLDAGVSVLPVPSASSPVAFVSSLSRALAVGEFDICHGLLNTLNPLAMVAAKIAGVPVRVAENLSTGHPREAKSAVKEILKPVSTLGATDLAANSQLAAEWLYGERADDVEIVLNPVDLGYYRPDERERARIRADLGLEGRFVVGWIGRYAPQKNPTALPGILAALLEREPSSELIAIGYGPLEGRVGQLAEDLGVAEHLMMLSATEDIRPLYRAMDAFVLPSLYEGLPVVAIEAQACGLPCVLSAEITREASAGCGISFVGLDEPQSVWADALLSHRGEAPLDNRAALEKAGFSTEVSAGRLVSLWEKALEREGR